MSLRRIVTSLIAISLILSESVQGAIGIEAERVDLHSYARPDQIRVRRVLLNLKVDFEQKILQGTATLSFVREPSCPPDAPLILDTRDLKIESVVIPDAPADTAPLRFELGKSDPILGSPLRVWVPQTQDSVLISYRTTPKASALQWLDAKGTAGGKQPFLFSQSEAIHARSWIPLQDSPGVRVTYGALIQAPKGLRAVMSADPSTEHATVPGEFRFEMPQAIPPYLIALAVGDLSFRPLGTRTGVYAEPSVVDSAAKEFADTEKMVAAAEKRFGPYRWGRYDILVLPPSFPFGGMENPKLTFATPTVIAGDRSLVALVAHELAHSWSGNLVSNATWRDFWLNEGFTTYLERRIVEDLYGAERAKMEGLLGLNNLKQELSAFPSRDQILHIDLAGRDPDDGMTGVPYEKGALLLTKIEQGVGRERFDAFLSAYFDHFAFKSITSADFVGYLRERLLKPEDIAARIDLNNWIKKPGLPEDAPVISSDRLALTESAARAWSMGKIPAETLNTATWSTHEWIHFLQSLPAKLTPKQMSELDNVFGFTRRGNAEVVEQWLVISIRNQYKPADARLEQFLTTIGRRKFLMPLYGELAKTPEGLAKARSIFAKARPFYHSIASESVKKILGGPVAK